MLSQSFEVLSWTAVPIGTIAPDARQDGEIFGPRIIVPAARIPQENARWNAAESRFRLVSLRGGL
jgi:hypothetical protein